MSLREFAFAFLLAASYWLLFVSLIPYTTTLDLPAWWYPMLGQNGASAVAWMQFVHSLGVIGAAIPVAFAAVYLFPQNPLRVGFLAAGLACAAMLYNLIGGYYIALDAGVSAFTPLQILSMAIDAIKIPALLLLAIWLVSRFAPFSARMRPVK